MLWPLSVLLWLGLGCAECVGGVGRGARPGAKTPAKP
jgi:hypothetical protein